MKAKSFKEKAKIVVVDNATVEQLAGLARDLNLQNWGSWTLPNFKFAYSANQYDCEGKVATTITLDVAISNEDYEINKERKFKVGGKKGHLVKYFPLDRI